MPPKPDFLGCHEAYVRDFKRGLQVLSWAVGRLGAGRLGLEGRGRRAREGPQGAPPGLRPQRGEETKSWPSTDRERSERSERREVRDWPAQRFEAPPEPERFFLRRLRAALQRRLQVIRKLQDATRNRGQAAEGGNRGVLRSEALSGGPHEGQG